MKINIYEVNNDTESQGKLLGVIQFISQKLMVDSPYKILDDIVNLAYKKAMNGNGNGKHYRQIPVHQFNTADFVEALGIETWKNGLIMEIAE
ncbi:MAG: hypothetical protein NTZ10_00300 [Candidatus Saganbacteria bacterium]|nr:hypothetical protein [Candidatus Saganbacteria bacterium]